MVEDEIIIIEGKILHKRDLGGVIFFEIDTAPQKISAIARKDAVEPAVYETIKSLHIDDYCHLEASEDGEDLLIQNVQTHIKKQRDSSWNFHQIEIIRSYSYLLYLLREMLRMRKYSEVRLPSIHYGKSTGDIFQVDFFGKSARLSSSNTLFLDIYALQLQKVFSLQKCFRAEKSHTSRHLAEFDMLEVARVNFTLEDAMEELKRLIDVVLRIFLKSDYAPLRVLDYESIRKKGFAKVEYEEIAKKYNLEGQGLGEYEREIARDGPVFVTHFPCKIASWSAQPLDEKYYRSFNLLLPGVGEVAEGTQRQTNAKEFLRILEAAGMEDQLGWYPEMLPYADFSLSSFGLGVDRLAMWIMDLKNIREIHPIYRDTNFSELKSLKKKKEKDEAPLSTVVSLSNMVREMNRKNLDLNRITKTASLLMLSGLSGNSIPSGIIRRCLAEQREDGGWIAVVDTMWNTYFLKLLDPQKYKENIRQGLTYLHTQINTHGLWGRSERDISRIPVTGMMFYLFPVMADKKRLQLLEELWQSEKYSLTYKAAYTLMAFKATGYQPRDKNLIDDTLEWLRENQRNDGGFAPWKDHPIHSDVFCTAAAVLGMVQYKGSVPGEVFQKSYHWLLNNRLPNGIWPYHEIEDGASWGLYALTQLLKHNLVSNG
ncbi:MAG: hypothetical protein JSV88_08120 [Candidatus Aminicenantes bacterium]|nr:MAG: hypothetical protein JSV88_08120 [Candidatus Aminicenantes bacterium]